MIVAVNEECENNFVHEVYLREGAGFSHQTGGSLAQGAVETFDVVCARFGLALCQLMSADDFGIRLPDVSKTVGDFVRVGNGVPQLLAGSLASTANDKSHDLPGAPT